MSKNPSDLSNSILKCLPQQESRRLQPHLESVDLPVRTQLERANRTITHAYFLESGLASVVANGSGERSIEVGIIGREGMTGLPLVMGAEQWPQETFMQSPGHGYRIEAAALKKIMVESADFRRCALHSAHVFFIQTAQTCLANGRAKLEERLARWLLMAHDRVDTEELTLTHEFLSYMLGVRRPGVSVALQLLEKQGLVRRQRGKITILDRAGLKKSSNGSYGVAEAEFERLLG